MVAKALFSSATDDWATPQDLFDKLDKEFDFQLDAAASRDNAKCVFFYSKEKDGLSHSWAGLGAVWLNPPYGKTIGQWVAKAHAESLKGATVVCLLPARTDTKWWHDYVLPFAEIRYIRGRLKFGVSKNSAPFPSAVVIFRPPGGA